MAEFRAVHTAHYHRHQRLIEVVRSSTGPMQRAFMAGEPDEIMLET